ncbi:terminase large subunit domain-containing protein [Rothia sp. ZJ1223]|uniref:terminase large subunit domain-containing protein n=1 Tax=Rothia sp. ZJ1223 TaxID=2811098 RepID=UPI00195B2E89|nr:terminase family protein [Rothia sp. ZJ1223]MBM7052224.1 terminase family protein [Rothia sp. ZJ1223]
MMSTPESLAPEDRALYEQLAPALPRNTTIPAPGAKHDLAAVESVSNMLQTPLMPWQKWFVRLATERAVDNPNRYRYKYVLCTVPRQSGKTTAMRCTLTERALKHRNRQAFYTAQTGKDASERWKDLVKKVEESPLKRFSKIRLAAGSQALTFVNGSSIRPFTPSAESLHGYTPHDVMLDEIFVWDAQEGADLLGAIVPAQNTLEDSQIWLVSTMGNAHSEFLNEWYEKGIVALNDPGSNIAIIDFGLPEGLDAFDPENWQYHPAVGHTIGKQDIAEAVEALTAGEFERAYMNRMVSAGETFIPMEVWDAAANPAQTPVPWGNICVGYDVAYGGESAAVVGAWYDQNDTIQIRTIHSEHGSTWLAEYLQHEIKPKRPRALGADSVGDTRVLTDALKNHGFVERPQELTPRDYASACIAFKTHLTEKTIQHNASVNMRHAVENAVIRPLGEGWAFSGSKSTGPIAELKAAVVAVKLLEQTKKRPGSPILRF